MGLLRCLTASAFAAAVVACDHTSPFTTQDYGATGPLHPGSPTQLTYDSGLDARASWLPDGSGFLYTQEQFGTPDDDRCLALMPASGGSVVRTICAESDLGHDSVNDFESAAVSADARIVYARTSMLAGAGHAGPDQAALVIAPFSNPLAATVLTVIPYFGPASRPVDMVSDVHWAGPSTVVFLTEQWTYPPACGTCITVDTVRTGLDIQRIDLGQPPILSLVPNTDQATSVAVGGPDTIFYTIAGDVGVHRRVLTSGADTVLRTFGAPPTDVTMAGSLLAVRVGTGVQVVDLQDSAYHASLSLATAHLYRPALSPDGHRIVIEAVQTDTAGQEFGDPDLWLWRLP